MRRDEEYLRDILVAADAVRARLLSVTRAEFLRDESLRDIVARRLTIVGEAVGKLTHETRLRAPDVGWAEVVAFLECRRARLLRDRLEDRLARGEARLACVAGANRGSPPRAGDRPPAMGAEPRRRSI